MRPSQPCSASLPQNSSVTPASSAMRLRTNSDVHSFSRNLRAVARSISCSSLNPKSISFVLPFREPEDALADDVLLHFRRAALDRVGARAQERVLPHAAVDGEIGAARELGIRPLDLHREL